MNEDNDLFEYVITDGPGTLVDHGVIVGVDPHFDCLIRLANRIVFRRLAMQFEPCDNDCETGK